jgi:hypothetical protein
MMQLIQENIFAPQKLEELFADTAVTGYTRSLLFSTVVDVMGEVVCRVRPSVNAAYLKKQDTIAVSLKALYDKLSRVEPAASAGLVRHTALEAARVIDAMNGARTPWLLGYRVLALDGNHLNGTEHRLKALRTKGGGALPGLALAVFDCERRVFREAICSEDGHAQECTLLEGILEGVRAFEVYLADRHFCISSFLFELNRREAFFIIRQHKGRLRWKTRGRRRFKGKSETGKVYEQEVVLTDPATGETMTCRRITIELDQPTRDGETELCLLTNLPAEDASALQVAALYRKRWTIETAFQELTVHLSCELNTLGYPPAALFGFCVAMACYNLFAVVQAALQKVHGEEKIENELSHYYLVDELRGTYRGMMIAVSPEDWVPIQSLSAEDLAKHVFEVAQHVDLAQYKKQKRGAKKPKPKRSASRAKHFSTAKLLKDKEET